VNLYTFLIFKFKWILGVGRLYRMSASLFVRENGLFQTLRSLAKKIKMIPIESYRVQV
jgi:hypothetical protein